MSPDTAKPPDSSADKRLQKKPVCIAKVAIRYAAVSFCVASSHRLPFAERSMDAVLRIYAPCKAGKLARAVKPGGILMTVSPGTRHMYHLKAQVYQQMQLHDEQEERLEGFDCESREALAYTMALSGGAGRQSATDDAFCLARLARGKGLAGSESFASETDFVIAVALLNKSDLE